MQGQQIGLTAMSWTDQGGEFGALSQESWVTITIASNSQEGG